MKRSKSLIAVSLALLFLGACGSIGDIYDGGSNNNTYDIRGTVDYVDVNSHSVYLTNVSGYSSMLSSGGNSVRVYYDDQTPVSYQGQTYRPADLERGDQVSVRVDESGNTLTARSMTVVYDVSGNGTSTSNSSTLRGTVRYVDSSRHVIEVESASWISRFTTGTGTSNVYYIQYDPGMRIDVQGNLYPVENLERGDVIDVQTTSTSGSTLHAQRLYLVRDATP